MPCSIIPLTGKTIFSSVSCPNIKRSEEGFNLSQSITEETCKNVVIHFPKIKAEVKTMAF
jgi:hypothetical protein